MAKRKKVPYRTNLDGSQNSSQSRSPPDPKYEGFKEGAVVSVALKNFMTYSDVKLVAGPYLNMILAPNGNGKSAIVCALIIGLGGDASTTGRATRMQDYIKFDCDVAIISITLYNPNGSHYFVQRKLVSTGGKDCHSEWILNNRISTLREVREFVASLSIRVDNLCQFLPQERVVEFARMNSKQLLAATQKAIGDANMFENHQKLVELSQTIKDEEAKKADLTKQLETECSLNQRLAEEVKRVREKETYQKKIDLLQKKKPWVEFEEARLNFIQARDEVEAKEKDLKKKKTKYAPLQKKVELASDALKKVVKKAENWEVRVKAQQTILKDIAKECERLSDEQAVNTRQFLDKRAMEKARLNDIKMLKLEIQTLEMQAQNLAPTPNLQPEIDRADAAIKKLLISQRKFEDRSYNLTLQKDKIISEKKELEIKLKETENVSSRRMARLQRVNNKVYEAAIWLEQNMRKFQDRVYPPILTQINVKDQKWVKYVETVIPSRDLFAFVFENIEDLKLFRTELKREKNISVNQVMAPTRRDFRPRMSIDQIRKFGFTNYIKDLFSAPDAVTSYLCENFYIQDIPVALEDVSSQIPDGDFGIRRYLCGDISCMMSVSRYDNELVTVTQDLNVPKFLDITLDEDLCKKMKDEISDLARRLNDTEAAIEENNDQCTRVEEEGRKLHQEKAELVGRRDEGTRIATQIQLKNDLMQRKERSKIDLNEAKQKMIAQGKTIFRKKKELLSKAFMESQKLKDTFYERAKIIFDILKSERTKEEAVKALTEASREFETLETEIQILKEKREKLKKEAHVKRTAAQQLTGFDQVDKPLLEKFSKLPDTIDAINAEIRNLSLRVDNLDSAYDGNVVRDFNKREQTIKQKQDVLRNLNVELEVKKKDRNDIKQLWLPKLEKLIENINRNFGGFMARLGCAGEVELGHDEHEDDFEQYGIRIKVKFRDSEALQELSSFHQSGGEKSVATMIYMIALQELTKVPFRIVDEINQGMDASNERKVFEFIVETAQQNSSQYFLLSPKLLEGLNFRDNMQIHVIFNGPYLNIKEFNL